MEIIRFSITHKKIGCIQAGGIMSLKNEKNQEVHFEYVQTFFEMLGPENDVGDIKFSSENESFHILNAKSEKEINKLTDKQFFILKLFLNFEPVVIGRELKRHKDPLPDVLEGFLFVRIKSDFGIFENVT